MGLKTGRNRRSKPPGLRSNRRGKPAPDRCPGYGKNKRLRPVRHLGRNRRS